MDEKILEELSKKFDTVLEKPGGQGFKYVPSENIFSRMNSVFRGNWTTEVVYQEIVDDQAIVRVRVMAQDFTNPDNKFYWHEGYASQQIARYSYGDNKGNIIDLGNSYMAAMSKAVKQACKKWGVALWLENEEASTSSPNPGGMPMPGPAPIEDKSPPIAEKKKEAVVPLPVENTTESTIPIPPPVEESTVMTSPELPSIPKPVQDTVPIPQITPAIEYTIESGAGRITDVQKIALNGILSLRKLEYVQLATDAFAASGIVRDPIPNPEDLDYEDAVIVIKYGNEMFRKN